MPRGSRLFDQNKYNTHGATEVTKSLRDTVTFNSGANLFWSGGHVERDLGLDAVGQRLQENIFCYITFDL